MQSISFANMEIYTVNMDIKAHKNCNLLAFYRLSQITLSEMLIFMKSLAIPKRICYYNFAIDFKGFPRSGNANWVTAPAEYPGKGMKSIGMKIAVLGAGAMGMLFGGYLSRENEVYLVDVSPERIAKIQRDGVMIREADGNVVLRPNAVVDTGMLGQMDLIVVFVKAMFTISALRSNQHLIGKNTYLMTLQNGAGHESKLLQFVDRDHVIIGSTQHNSSVIDNGYINHGGGGRTSIGLLAGGSERVAHVAQTLTNCGISCVVSDEVKRQIWSKLFLNTAASSLTAVLQVPLGFILDDPHACSMMEKMVREAVAVANAEGIANFDDTAVIEDIKTVLSNARDGYTSIYADIKNGSRTEVDTISGSVVNAAKELGVSVPCHEMVVSLIHAMEDKAKANR